MKKAKNMRSLMLDLKIERYSRYLTYPPTKEDKGKPTMCRRYLQFGHHKKYYSSKRNGEYCEVSATPLQPDEAR